MKAKTKVISFLCAAYCVALLSSCEIATLEDPKELKASLPPTQAEFEQLFHSQTRKVWTCQSFTLAGLKGLQNCRLDDMITIISDGTYEYDGGTLLCGAEDSQRIKKGTWKILDNIGNLLFDEGTPNAYKAKVITLEAQKTVLRGSYFGFEINGTYVSN